MSSKSQLKLAQRIRDNQNWLILVFLLIGLIPAIATILSDTFPQVSPKYQLLTSVLVSIVCAQICFAWATRKLPKPICNACGGQWVIVESGPGRNAEHFQLGGSCPHCGVEITE
jgi:uncharacterized membrane protein